MSKHYNCDICGKVCCPENLQIDARRIGVVDGQCNMSEVLEQAQFDICIECRNFIKKKYHDNHFYISDLAMDILKKARKLK